MKRVLMAMSGGVDSSVAAAILCEQGYDVIGVAMKLAPEAPSGAKRAGTCCSHEDFEDARRVAERLGFPFYVVDLRADFAARVIGNFAAEYLRGRTPNPCVMCNREIKFDRLWQRARALDADFVATGHYARIDRDERGRYHLMRAADRAKDQSYFLFTLRQEELARTLFPLGSLTKPEVRVRARELGLVNADKPESQEICFVPDRDYAAVVQRIAKAGQIIPGRIVDRDGRTLGSHSGIHQFTVGQRRGLGIATGEPLYVNRIDAATGDVTVASLGESGSSGLIAASVSFTGESPPDEDSDIEVKIRYRHPGIPARLRRLEDSRAEVRFLKESPAVTPGQASVFYRRDEMIGGGFIERAL
jgi:tRNA-uridine 2-sulfurtransferase